MELWPKLGDRVVVKPSNAGSGAGVSVGVDNNDKFKSAWSKAKQAGISRSKVVVEEEASGVEVRCYVVGGVVVSCVLRMQPYVTGDGKKSIAALVESLVSSRREDLWYSRWPVTVDEGFLALSGYSLESVPQSDEVILLNPFHLPQLGGTTIEISGEINANVTRLAKEAFDAIPGLEVGAVDILVDDIWSGKSAKVLEINTAPSIVYHLYPLYGAPVMVHREVSNYFLNLVA